MYIIDDIEQMAETQLLFAVGSSMLLMEPLSSQILQSASQLLKSSGVTDQDDWINRVIKIAKGEDALNSIFKQSTVVLWSSLEAFVNDFLILWLKNVPSALKSDDIVRIKISIAQYNQMNDEERLQYILDMLKQSLNVPNKQGINGFEALLQVFDLTGSIDRDISRDLYELSHIRNVIVHRRSIADKRLIDACPWLNLSIGDRVIVDSAIHLRHVNAVKEYIKTMFQRVTEFFSSGTTTEISK